MEKNPCIYATLPKYTAKKRDIWTAETLFHALEEMCIRDRRCACRMESYTNPHLTRTMKKFWRWLRLSLIHICNAALLAKHLAQSEQFILDKTDTILYGTCSDCKGK